MAAPQKRLESTTAYNNVSVKDTKAINKYFEEHGDTYDKTLQESLSKGQTQGKKKVTEKSLFSKAYYLLDNFTPYIKATLVVNYDQSDSTKNTDKPTQLRIDLFKGLNNNILDFSVDYAAGAVNCTLKFVDTDGVLADILLINFWKGKSNGANYPQITIEYGWTIPDNIDGWALNRETGYVTSAINSFADPANKNSSPPPVIFKDTITFLVLKIDTDFQLPMNVTITGQKGETEEDYAPLGVKGPKEFFQTQSPLNHVGLFSAFLFLYNIINNTNNKDKSFVNTLTNYFKSEGMSIDGTYVSYVFEKWLSKLGKNNKELVEIKTVLGIKNEKLLSSVLHALYVMLRIKAGIADIGSVAKGDVPGENDFIKNLYDHAKKLENIKEHYKKPAIKLNFLNELSPFFYDLYQHINDRSVDKQNKKLLKDSEDLFFFFYEKADVSEQFNPVIDIEQKEQNNKSSLRKQTNYIIEKINKGIVKDNDLNTQFYLFLKSFVNGISIHPFDAYIFYRAARNFDRSENGENGILDIFGFGGKSNTTKDEKIEDSEIKNILGYIDDKEKINKVDLEEIGIKASFQNEERINRIRKIANKPISIFNLTADTSWADIAKKTLGQINYIVKMIRKNKEVQTCVPLDIKIFSNSNTKPSEIEELSRDSTELGNRRIYNDSSDQILKLQAYLENYLNFFRKISKDDFGTELQDATIQESSSSETQSNNDNLTVREEREGQIAAKKIFEEIYEKLEVTVAKLDEAIKDKTLKTVMFITPKKGNASIFDNATKLTNEILQSYSIRAPRGFGSEYFLDGGKGISLNNLPDILEFTPEINYENVMAGLTFLEQSSNTTIFTGDSSVIQDNIKNIQQIKNGTKINEVKISETDNRKEQIRIFEEMINVAKTSNNVSAFISLISTAKNKTLLKEYEIETIDLVKNNKLTENAGVKLSVALRRAQKYLETEIEKTKKISSPLTQKSVRPMSFQLSPSDLGDPGSRGAALAGAKSKIQAVRQEIMKNSFTVKAKLKILGEPAWGYNLIGDLGNKIFLRVFNIDGTESIYSGLYRVSGALHEINTSYTTTLSIERDAADASYMYAESVGKTQQFVT